MDERNLLMINMRVHPFYPTHGDHDSRVSAGVFHPVVSSVEITENLLLDIPFEMYYKL
jgi:hypothetical protein